MRPVRRFHEDHKVNDQHKHNNVPECVAQDKHAHALKINFGGEPCWVYFDVEADPAEDNGWVVAEGLQVFFNGHEITRVFEGGDVDEMIYMLSAEVERQMQERAEP
jgi:hypothetical protein